jgi:hypothetical protein
VVVHFEARITTPHRQDAFWSAFWLRLVPVPSRSLAALSLSSLDGVKSGPTRAMRERWNRPRERAKLRPAHFCRHRKEMEMIPPHNDSIWPDDTKRAAVTLALAAATNSDMQFRDVIDTIKEALDSGRSLQFVMELIRLLTAELGEHFRHSDTAAAYQQLAAQCQAAQEDMRSRGEWRSGDHTTHESS